MKNQKRTAILRDFGYIMVGTALYAAALTAFLAPNQVSPGGVTGIAAIVSDWTGIPTGNLTLILNAPLFIWGYAKLGPKFIGKTVIATIILSIWIDVLEVVLPVYNGNRLLAALYGGLIGGAGLSLVFLCGGSTGGSDIAAKIISIKFPFFSIGRTVMLLDAAVIVLASVAYRSFETALYTTITIFVSAKTIDSLIYGADKGKLAFIVTEKTDDLKQAVFNELHRGVTVIQAHGGYSNGDRAIVMCAVRVGEASRLHRIVKQAAPDAFMVITEAGEIVGEGFKVDLS